jgi:hypothetical protein
MSVRYPATPGSRRRPVFTPRFEQSENESLEETLGDLAQAYSKFKFELFNLESLNNNLVKFNQTFGTFIDALELNAATLEYCCKVISSLSSTTIHVSSR